MSLEENVRLSRNEAASHVQESKDAFTAWINVKLSSKGVSISNLLEDLSDGTVLSQLLQELSGEKMPRLKPGTMRIQKLANLNTVFTFLRNYVKLVDIGPQDVLDGNETRVLGMLWSIISVFSIRSVNLTMPGVRHMGDLKNRLIMWGQKNAEAKSSNGCIIPASIIEMGTGQVLLAILSTAAPNKIPYAPERTEIGTLRKAVKLAREVFNVPPMLDPEANPNARNIEKIVVMYLTELYLALPNVGKGINTTTSSSPQHRSLNMSSTMSGYDASGGGLDGAAGSSPGTGTSGFSNSPALGRAALHASTLANAGSPALEPTAGDATQQQQLYASGQQGRMNAPTRELEVDALRRRCYELEHAANALPATLEKMRELQAYTKDLAEQYEAQLSEMDQSLQARIEGEQAWRNAASKADAEAETLRSALRSKEAEVEGTRRQLTASGESEREQASDRQRALKIQIEEMKAAHEKEVAALRDELASNGEWWRSRVDAVREEEEAHTEEVEEHVESLSTMLVQAEKQLTVTKSALEDSSTARNELKALVSELEEKNDMLERTVQKKEGEIKRLGRELEDASRTANVFEDELREVATKLADSSSDKEGLAKRIDSYHTQEDNYRRYTNDLVNFSARAGAALATGVQEAISAVDLLNRVDHDITGSGSSSSSSGSDGKSASSSAYSFSHGPESKSGTMPIGAALQARLSEVLSTGAGGSSSGKARAPADIWEVSSFLEARVDLAVKALATLTTGAKALSANTDEIKRTVGTKMLQLERNLEGALRDREGVRGIMAAKDRSISDLEKRVGVLTREKESVEQQLRLVQSGEGTRLGDLQRMVEAQAFELSSQEAALAEATRHWMNHETATEDLQATTQKLISIITTALAEEPAVQDEELNGLVLVGPTDIQGLEERIFKEYDHFHTATYHMLEEVVRLLCDRAHALNLSAGKTYAKLNVVEQDKTEALRKMVQARDQLDKAELRNTSLQRQRLEMGKQLGWLENGQSGKHEASSSAAINSAADQEEINALRMRCLELEGKLEHRDMVGDKLESLMDRLKDMATAGISAVAAARAARNTLAARDNNNGQRSKTQGGQNEEDKEGDADDFNEDEELASNVYDELARFQESLSNLETPVASGSLEFAVLVTGFVVQTLSHELLERDPKESLLINANSTNSQNMLAHESGVNSDARQQQLGQAMALFDGQQQENNNDGRIMELKNQVSVLGEQLKQQTQAAAAAKAALRESELNALNRKGDGSGDDGENNEDADDVRAREARKEEALQTLQEERDRLESELSEALEKVSTMSASVEAGGDMKRLMELENKIADLEEEMENPKALSIHRASQAHKFIDEAEDIESQLEELDPEEESEAYESLEHRLKELTDHISLLLNDILAYLKGDVLRLVPSELKALTQVVMTCKDRAMCVKVFKEAHLFAKQIITEAAGQKAKLGRNAHWDFDPDLLENVAERRWAEMMKHLKRLVIAYDNMPPDMRGDLLTFREIIKNLDWLVIMSFHSVEVEEKRREKAKKRLFGHGGANRNLSDDQVSFGRGSSSGILGGGRIDSGYSTDNFDTASMASYGSVGSRGSARSFSASAASTSYSGASGVRRGGSRLKAAPYAAFVAQQTEKQQM